MPQIHKLHPDPVLAANEVYWAPRAFILRTLSRAGWLSTSQLLERYNGMADEPASRDAFQAALARLVRQSKVERVGTHNTGRYRLAAGMTLAAALERRESKPYACSICGKHDANRRGHANGHLGHYRGRR